MYIDKLTISAFGKLENCSFEFKDGLNLLYGPNEAGKTTIMAFIKFIFYGINLRKKTGELSFKEKFLPWNGNPACGSLSFTDDDGEKYIISRFQSADKTKINVINAVTGEEIKNVDVKNLGKHFIGLNEEAFSSTSFLSNLTSHIKVDREGELVKRLANLTESGLEDISFVNAFEELKERIAQLSSERRKNAVIPSLKAEILHLENEVSQCNKQFLRCDELKEKIKNLNLQISEYKKQQERLLLENNIEKSNVEANVAHNISDEISVLEKSDFLKYNSASEKEIKLIEKYVFKTKNKINFYIFITFLFVITLMAAFFMRKTAFWIVPLFAAMGATFLFRVKANKTNFTVQKILKKYNCTSVENFLKGIKLCENVSLKIEMLKDELDALNFKKEKNNFNVAECKNTSNDFTIHEFDDKIEAINHEIEFLMREVVLCEEQLQTSLFAGVNLKNLKNEKAILQSKLDEANKKLASLNLSCEILQKAFEELKKQFAPQLAKIAANVLREITDGKYTEILTDDEFKVKLKSGYEFNDSLFYSRGTYEQIYFSMRIALLNIAVYDKNLPLFLDDAFGFYDNDRFINVLKFILNESRKRQIFISSCRSSEYMFFRNEDVNVIELSSERDD